MPNKFGLLYPELSAAELAKFLKILLEKGSVPGPNVIKLFTAVSYEFL
jgi:hypothetical protein